MSNCSRRKDRKCKDMIKKNDTICDICSRSYEKGYADAIDKMIQAVKNQFFCIEDLCDGTIGCNDCRIKYLEKLKEKKDIK